MTAQSSERSEGLRQLAFDKMSAVLGPARSGHLLAQILSEHDLQLETPDDLHAFAAELTKLGGFEGAVGAMLGVRAVMLGARGR